MLFLALYSNTLDLKWNNTCVVKVLNVSFNVRIVSFQIQYTRAPSQKNKNSVTVQLHTACVISVWNGSLESARPLWDACGMMEAHVIQTLEVTPLLNCGKWMTGVCFAWRVGLVKHRAQYSHTDYYGLAGSPSLLRLDLFHLCETNVHLCPAATRTNYFSSFLLSLPHFFTPLDGPRKRLR